MSDEPRRRWDEPGGPPPSGPARPPTAPAPGAPLRPSVEPPSTGGTGAPGRRRFGSLPAQRRFGALPARRRFGALLRAESPRRLAGAASLSAAVLVLLAALALLLADGDGFPMTLGDRLRLAGSVVAFPVPLLLAVGLGLREPDGAAARSTVDRTADLAAVAVGGAAVALLAGALVAHLSGSGDAGGVDGLAGWASAVLTDLAALALTAAATWWALQRSAPPPPGG